MDIQLKVLQALPTLLSNYADTLTGSLLHIAFDVSFSLHASKTGVVSNTAAAVIQQLVASTFDKVENEDGKYKPLGGRSAAADDHLAHNISPQQSINVTGLKQGMKVTPLALDAFQVGLHWMQRKPADQEASFSVTYVSL